MPQQLIGMDGKYSVEVCSWDLTMGAAANVLGKLFLRGTSSSSQNIPEAIDHVGIIVYNRLYEYGHNGILKSSIPRSGEDPMPQYPGCKLRKRELLGYTGTSREEFVEWIINVKYGVFRGSNYDMISHNCIDFAKAVCEFLRIPPSPNWEKVSNWAKTNRKLADVLTRGFRSRSLRENGRSASLQESSTSSDPRNASSNPSASCSITTNQRTVNNNNVSSSSPRRRRFSVCSAMSRSDRASLRSASMETLPPTYEEALRMNYRRDSTPKYEDLIRE